MRSLNEKLRNLKHVSGWRSSRRYLAFAVDDYGTIRTANASARDYLQKHVPSFGGQMDEFDAVETIQDLEALFQVLSGYADEVGKHPIFTAYCLAANPNLERIRGEWLYSYESLDQTYEKLASRDPGSYSGIKELWRQGISEGLIRPQCHGREHFCVPLFELKLHQRAPDLVANLDVESVAGLSGSPELPGVGFTHAFGLQNTDALPVQRRILEDGFRMFEGVFGYPSKTFVPPALKLDRRHDEFIASQGVKAIDVPFVEKKRVSSALWWPRLNFLSVPKAGLPGRFVRSLSFEPCSGIKSDPVGQALREIEIAFNWQKPAIVSSHRVNYGGHIDAGNRRRGLSQLNDLIKRILSAWPDVRFVSMDTLVDLMDQPESLRPIGQ